LALEPGADVIVSVNFGRRRRAAGPKKLALSVARLGAAFLAKKCFFKDSRKNFVLTSNFSDDLF